MAEPKCYHRRLNSRPQQSHSRAMTQYMHADGFLSQRWTAAGGYLNVFSEPMFDGVTAERRPRLGDEKWLRRFTSALGEPNTQEGDHTRGNRCDTQLPSFPRATDMGASA